MKILIVDDDADLLEILQETVEYLVQEPKTVMSTNSSEEALTLIAKEAFNVIITDYNMPKYTGKDIIDQGLKYKVPKIFLISGENPNIENYKTVIFYGKPIHMSNFIEDISSK